MLIDGARRGFRNLYLKRLVKRGMKLGKNCSIEKGVNFDGSFPWLIEIGDNVTLAPWVYLLAHDASTKNAIGYTKVGHVIVEDNVFIGARSIILPNVRIGRNSVIAANSVVSRDIPANSVAGGAPCKVFATGEEFAERNRRRFESSPKYDLSYTLGGGISEEKKRQMREDLSEHGGYIV